MARNRYYAGPPSDHFDGTRFFNPGQPSTDRSLSQLLRWQLQRNAATWPAAVPVTPAVPPPRSDRLRLTFAGHASMLIQAAGLNILTDPVWSDRASPFSFAGPRRVTAPGIAFADLPPIHAVLLTHNHYDHMDLSTLRRLDASHHPLLVMPLGNDATVHGAIPNARIATADWHQSVELGEGTRATLTPANHWSSRSPTDRRMALWCGYHLATPAGSVWVAGDTGYGDGTIFPAIAARHGAPDMALLPIGAYDPRWFMAAQHVNPEEAVRIFTAVGAHKALGIHWGTFQLTDEAREEPADRLVCAVQAAGIAADRFVAAQPGGMYQA